jgi:hypothetical protein
MFQFEAGPIDDQSGGGVGNHFHLCQIMGPQGTARFDQIDNSIREADNWGKLY